MKTNKLCNLFIAGISKFIDKFKYGEVRVVFTPYRSTWLFTPFNNLFGDIDFLLEEDLQFIERLVIGLKTESAIIMMLNCWMSSKKDRFSHLSEKRREQYLRILFERINTIKNSNAFTLTTVIPKTYADKQTFLNTDEYSVACFKPIWKKLKRLDTQPFIDKNGVWEFHINPITLDRIRKGNLKIVERITNSLWYRRYRYKITVRPDVDIECLSSNIKKFRINRYTRTAYVDNITDEEIESFEFFSNIAGDIKVEKAVPLDEYETKLFEFAKRLKSKVGDRVRMEYHLTTVQGKYIRKDITREV